MMLGGRNPLWRPWNPSMKTLKGKGFLSLYIHGWVGPPVEQATHQVMAQTLMPSSN
jgi:hypothetical protein